MTSLKSVNRRVGSLFAVGALLLATVTPGLVPAFASAAQVTGRSVALSSSSAGATGVSYNVTFTPVSSAGAVVLDFCSDSPLIESTCTAPTGFDASSAAAAGYTISQTGATLDNTIVAAKAMTGGVEQSVPLTGIANPTDAGALYVRMVTYDTEGNAQAYTSTALTANAIDSGSAAVSITDSVGVSAAVLESMTFCVSSEEVTGGSCGKDGDPTPLDAPTLKLGEDVGGVVALGTAVSTGDLYSQISTNAQDGAIVSVKSGTTDCGGLVRFGAPTSCDIVPANATNGFDITTGQAKFGVKVASAADPTEAGVTADGTYQIAGTGTTPYYSASVFKLNFVSGNATGITSPYGDPLLDTDGAPVNNKNVKITFGAAAANNTPAGLYSADLSLIATGKF